MLFKYLRPERIDVIEKLEVRFTQPGALNDPFEMRPRLESLVSEAETLANFRSQPVDLDPILRQAYSMLPEQQRSILSYESAAQTVRSFMDTDEARSATAAGLLGFLGAMKDMAAPACKAIYDAIDSNIGILSLAEVDDDQLMWAHYADSHRGIVLGFDEKHSFFNRRRSENDEFYFLRRVVYADVPPASSLLSLDGDSIFVTKGQKWAYEREWRMLAPLKDAARCLNAGGDTIYLYSFPPDALSTVVIGARAAKSLERSVLAILGSNADLAHVRVLRAILDIETQRVRVD